jgi:hypothetical protein
MLCGPSTLGAEEAWSRSFWIAKRERQGLGNAEAHQQSTALAQWRAMPYASPSTSDAESLLHLYFPDDSRRRISLSSTLRYGARVAVPRIVEIWKHFGVKAKQYLSPAGASDLSKAIGFLLRDGHEIAHPRLAAREGQTSYRGRMRNAS